MIIKVYIGCQIVDNIELVVYVTTHILAAIKALNLGKNQHKPPEFHLKSLNSQFSTVNCELKKFT